jgi:hypothetical protein
MVNVARRQYDSGEIAFARRRTFFDCGGITTPTLRAQLGF